MRGARVIGGALVVILLGTGKNARAQNVDLVSLSAQYMPEAQMAGAPGKVQVASYDLSANVPLPLDGDAHKTFFFPGFSYHMDAVSFADVPDEFVQLRAFQSIDASTLFVRLLPNNWSFAARTSLGLAGDFSGVDSRMLRSSSFMSVSHAFSKKFVLGGGALTSFSFGSFLPLPAIYVDWKPADGFELEGFLPTWIHARYTIARRVRIGILAELQGNEYAVRDSRIRNAYPCVGAANDDTATAADERVARPAECFDNLAYSVGIAGLAVGVRLVSSLWLNGIVGHSVFRRLDRRNSARDLLSDGRDEIPNVVVTRLALVWRLPGLD